MTLSAQEAQELAQSAPPVPRAAAQEVLDYLLYHKAMIGESLDPSNSVDRYLEMVRELKEGVHVVIDDPYQKATALLFELVLSESFNPWSIDLTRFTQVYLERAQKERQLDFAVAGRLIHMAWRILLLQSQEVLTQREREILPPAEPQDDLPGANADDGYLGAMTSPEQVDATEALLRGENVPLDGMVRHEGTRQVSLLELAGALQEAQDAARLFQEAQEQREKLRAWQKTTPEVLAHGDVPESDLAGVWARVAEHAIGEAFPFHTLVEQNEGPRARERVIQLFLSLLFLSKEGVLVLHQDNLSESGFFIERQTEVRKPNGSEGPEPAETASAPAAPHATTEA